MNKTPRPCAITHAALGLLLSIACASATAGEGPQTVPTAPTLYYACMSEFRYVEYDSAAFANRNPGPTFIEHGRHHEAMSAAFDAWLQQKYGFHGLVNCGQYDTLAQAREWLAGRVSLSTQEGNIRKLTATDWTYNAGSSASQPAAAAPANPSTANAAAPPAPAPRLPTAFFVCISAMNNAEYDSAVFEAENSAFHGQMMRLAYRVYVEQKYDFHGFPSCISRPTRAEVQKYLLEYAPAVRGLASHRISTGWVYDPKATAAAAPATPPTPVATATPAPKPASPPAAAPKPAAPKPAAPKPAASATSIKPSTPAASAAPKSEFVVCNANREPPTRYYNPPINGGNGNYELWQASYKAFMQQKYGYRRTVGCSKFPTLAEAQAYYQRMLEEARISNAASGTPLPTVITQWKYP